MVYPKGQEIEREAQSAMARGAQQEELWRS